MQEHVCILKDYLKSKSNPKKSIKSEQKVYKKFKFSVYNIVSGNGVFLIVGVSNSCKSISVQ